MTLDEICQRYDELWRSGDPPDLHSFLKSFDGVPRAELAPLLVEIDIDYRKQAGESVSPSDYADVVSASEIDHLFANELTATLDTGSRDHRSHTRMIGDYKLLQQIGEGGMGEVWMAEQLRPVRRRVALKLIRANLDNREVIARFEAERQALAMMDHQNIAKVFDAGATEAGLPYFVMELVQGIPITRYCDENKLTPNDRLGLFADVCSAVQHAHQKGIIHRDLKPSNVLVTLYDGKPVPKIIDFGLAKALQHQTRLTDKTLFTEFGKVVGTLQYMSPEQAEMNALNVDTRSDIYSLGVILYELLTGSTPIERETLKQQAILQVLETIRSGEAQRPSIRLSSSGDALSISAQRRIEPRRLRQILSGELDWIVMKALEKDRSRRYATAEDFAQDIRRYLSDDTVQARPPSTAYRVSKFIRKNRGLVASVTAIALLLVTATVITSWLAIQNDRARKDMLRQKTRADAQALKAEALADLQSEQRKLTEQLLYISVLDSIQNNLDEGKTVQARELLAKTNFPDRGWEYDYLRNRVGPAKDSFRVGLLNWMMAHAISDDGQIAAFGTSSGELELWNIVRRKRIHEIEAHKTGIASIAISPDRRLIATASDTEFLKGNQQDDGSIKIWKLDSMELVGAVKAGFVSRVVFSPDGSHILFDNYDLFFDRSSLYRIDLNENLAATKVFEAQQLDQIRFFDFAASGQELVCVSAEGTILRWNQQRREIVDTVKNHFDSTHRVTAAAISPNQRVLYIGTDSGHLQMWDLSTNQFMCSTSLDAKIRTLAVRADSEVLLAGCDKSVRVINAKSLRQIDELREHTSSVTALAFPDNGKAMMSFDLLGEAVDWSSRQQKRQMIRENGGQSPFTTMYLSDDEERLYTAGLDSKINIWEVATGYCLGSFPIGIVNDLTESEQPGQLISRSELGDVYVWDVQQQKRLRRFGRRLLIVPNTPFQIAPDGQRYAVGFRSPVYINQVDSDANSRQIKTQGKTVQDLAFSRDSQNLILLVDEVRVEVWNVNELRMLASHEIGTDRSGESQHYRRMNVSENGKHVSLMGTDICLLDLETGDVQRFSSPGSLPNTASTYRDNFYRWQSSVEFRRSGAGRIVVSGKHRRIMGACYDGSIRFWDLDSGELRRQWHAHEDSDVRQNVRSSAYDRGWIALGNYRNEVEVWDGKNDRPIFFESLYPLTRSTLDMAPITDVSLNRDAGIVIACNDRGKFAAFDLESGEKRVSHDFSDLVILQVECLATSDHCLVLGQDGNVYSVDLLDSSLEAVVDGSDDPIRSIEASHDRSLMALIHQSGKLSVYTADGELIASKKANQDRRPLGVTWNLDDSRLAVVFFRSASEILDARTLTTVIDVQMGGDFRFAPGDRRLISIYRAIGQLDVWDIVSETQIYSEYVDHSEGTLIADLFVDPNGMVYTVFRDGRIRKWNGQK